MKIIIITGQTATGKTSLAVKFARKFKGELVNCDSRQIYKYIDVITGKDKRLLKTRKIWLIDLIKPDQYFSSFDYKESALRVVKDILTRRKTPIIVGGTYLYLKHLLYGVETENIPPDRLLRRKLANKKVENLQEILRILDVPSLNRLSHSEINNPQRLIRKIEIIKFRAKRQHIEPPRFDIALQKPKNENIIILPDYLRLNSINFKIIGLKFKNNDDLKKAIEQRVEKRLEQGAIEEVKNLLTIGFKSTDPGLKTIGYQQLINFLEGRISKEEAIKQWITKEVQYAKRQYAFMKKDPHISWREV
ncbi:hypothetical protein A2774_03005 [Candidatus Roizmanbacteria bacterium RIFCSPHIGHO2_01_FULL_39_12c]|uniref:tRNA dimethylallyltransferase n=1 Tax=Candidatus Roizmanbacteria bacterium RIFCSPHIGHO2_01_FULL_39_12c TaxID=1802031 RepID=A0A1F7GBT9_9BACT|nr:MAG: hypothetical protein A2774_03005 [Candidatus Roizmanbacteria bacterium RIFCSPHIGHO2_01_FULL_39_12c]OGK47432.1 MAG: hypothetical protein A2963_04735 [Candidatus Roizmanbacteria bacterium RIFCSPLOWO2_01_FULL_40_13]